MELTAAGTPAPPPTAELEQTERAAAEVDPQLLDLCLARSPVERLRVATRAQRALSKFRRDASR